MAAGTEMTNATFQTYINANINTNGVGGITGAKLNTALNNIAESLLFALHNTNFQAITAGAARAVTFPTAFSGGSTYQLVLWCFDASGQRVTYVITSQTVSGFSIQTPVNCTLHYFTIKNN